jgi:hypothetical protein
MATKIARQILHLENSVELGMQEKFSLLGSSCFFRELESSCKLDPQEYGWQ